MLSTTSVATAVLLLQSCAWPQVAARNFGHKTDPDGPYEFIISPRPHEDPQLLAGLPSSFDWRDVGGKDYTARIQNQHQPGPGYCGACWAFATVTHLSARFNIARGGRWPGAQLNVQALISCGPNINNGCDGSDPNLALKFIHEHGLPHESCHTYQGESLECTPYNLCQDCMTGFQPQTCWAREKFPMYHIKEYGYIKPTGNVSDADVKVRQAVIDDMGRRMKAEIRKRGPIICQIACPDPAKGAATSAFPTTNEKLPYGQVRGYMDDYTPYFNIVGPNFSPFIMNNTDFVCPGGDWNNCVDHDVTVVGWGEEDGVPYWMIQNSWGDWWGEGGFFRVIMGRNNLGIESACFFGVPDVSDLPTDAAGYQLFTMGTSAGYADRFAQAAQLTDQKSKVIYA